MWRTIFYKATVYSIMLFGSETWNLSLVTLKGFEGFHIQVAWCMAYCRQEHHKPKYGDP
jgi:hypothetical protein